MTTAQEDTRAAETDCAQVQRNRDEGYEKGRANTDMQHSYANEGGAIAIGTSRTDTGGVMSSATGRSIGDGPGVQKESDRTANRWEQTGVGQYIRRDSADDDGNGASDDQN